MSGERIEFTFPAWYHERTTDRRVRTHVTTAGAETVVLLRHTSNMGYPGVLDLREDNPHWPILSMLEHGPRMRRIIDENIVPLVAAARSVGARILYAIDGWPAAEKYSQWHAIRDRVPERPDWTPPRCPDESWRRAFETEVFMPGYADALREMMQVIDIASPLAPQAHDWVATTNDQIKMLLNENGIWTVIHAGFDINNDIMFSPAAGAYWFSKVSRGIILRDCVAGEEPADMAEGERLKNTIVDFLEMGPAYSAIGSDVRAAMTGE